MRDYIEIESIPTIDRIEHFEDAVQPYILTNSPAFHRFAGQVVERWMNPKDNNQSVHHYFVNLPKGIPQYHNLIEKLQNTFVEREAGFIEIAFDCSDEIVGIAQVSPNIMIPEKHSVCAGNFSVISVKKGTAESMIRSVVSNAILGSNPKFDKINFAIDMRNTPSMKFHSKLPQIFQHHPVLVTSRYNAKLNVRVRGNFMIYSIEQINNEGKQSKRHQ